MFCSSGSARPLSAAAFGVRVLILLFAALFVLACDDSKDDTDTGGSNDADNDVAEDVDGDVGDDVEDDGADAEDAGDVQDADADTGPDPSRPAAIDLDDWLTGGTDGAAPVSVYEVTSADQLVGGDSATGRVGDFILENGRARFVVEDDYRGMSPCPWGGNIIDSDIVRDGGDEQDVVGEVCMMLNIAQTLRPISFEVLRDGSDGGAGVLAVTGVAEKLDFLNVFAMIEGFLPGLPLNFPIDPNRILPVTITVYYILEPGDLGVHVVSAVRNDSSARIDVAAGHLIRAAGATDFYNPLASTGGFGYSSVGADNIETEPMPFMALIGDTSSHAYVPSPSDNFDEDLPAGAGYITVSGAAAGISGGNDLLNLLFSSPQQFANSDSVLHMEPDEVGTIDHWHFAGDGSLATMADEIYPLIGADTGTVSGVITDGDGPVAGIRVSAADSNGHGVNQALTDEAGVYSMRVPVGDVQISARAPGRFVAAASLISVVSDGAHNADLTISDAAELTVNVSLPDGTATPARLSVLCVGGCPNPATSAEENLRQGQLPDNFAAVEYAQTDGVARAYLHPGQYRVVVSRGLEWSAWPNDFVTTGGELITVAAGEQLTLEAEIAPVVDSHDAASGDFHIHALASSDSPVPNIDRVLNYVSDGVDVMVSTDHDVIADFAPAIDALGLGSEVTSIIGVETTTAEQGHFNAFPLERDEEDRLGGALDWGDGANNTVHMSEIGDWASSFPGEQVFQVNHPAGTIGGLRADPLLGVSRADPEKLSLDPGPTHPVYPDTGLWAENFTAIEVMNGVGIPWSSFRWWLTMVGRGFTPTSTAVTDTHQQYNDLGGAPRTWVFVEGDDAPGTMSEADFVESINDGQAIVSNGPFFRVTVSDADGSATLGETLTTTSGTLDIEVEIDIPEWMLVDTIDIYSNVVDDIYFGPGESDDSELEPTLRVPIDITGSRVVSSTGAYEHAHYVHTENIEFDVSADAYIVVVVRGLSENTRTYYPIVPRSSLQPWAHANPVYIDVDGGGYNTIPLAGLIAEETSSTVDTLLRAEQRRVRRIHEHAREHGFNPDTMSGAQLFGLAYEMTGCQH